jgi:hypothetical protein
MLSSAPKKPDLSYGLEGGPLSMPLSCGQKQVARVNPLSGVSPSTPQFFLYLTNTLLFRQMFTQFEYLPSDYDRTRLMGKFDRLRHKLCQIAPSGG